MFYVYAIKSTLVKYIYVGLTININERLKRHNSGREKTTRSFKPYYLIFLTQVENRVKARQIEKYLKSGIGKEFLKTFI